MDSSVPLASAGLALWAAHDHAPLSPAGAQIALRLACMGTRPGSATRACLETALGEGMHVTPLVPDKHLRMTHTLWCRSISALRPAYVRAIATVFRAEAREVPETAAEALPAPGTFATELRFRAPWVRPFRRELTVSSAPWGTSHAALMRLYASSDIQVGTLDGFQAAVLPYADPAYAAVVLLAEDPASQPPAPTGELWAEALGLPQCDQANIYLPRFRVSWRGSVRPALEGLGAGQAFREETPGGFTALTAHADTRFWLADVTQTLDVEIDEAGSGSGGADEPEALPVRCRDLDDNDVEEGDGEALWGLPFELRADRPFFFGLAREGELLFCALIDETHLLP